MRADGTDPIQLTDKDGAGAFPSVSPNGARITWHSERHGNLEIYTMSADGGDIAPPNERHRRRYQSGLVPQRQADRLPERARWQLRDLRDDAEDSGLRRLTQSPTAADRNPDWSPNGKQILFNSIVGGTSDVSVMNTDGHRPGEPDELAEGA